jgi:hypothetical protein
MFLDGGPFDTVVHGGVQGRDWGSARPTSVGTGSTDQTGLDYFRMVLAQWGLNAPSLITWADEQLREGFSLEKILFDMERRPEFDAAFPEIRLRRERAAATGIQLSPIGPGEILEYRTQAKSLMRSYGLPDTFFSTNANFTELIVGDVSMAELDDRLQMASRRVANAPFEVKAAFGDLFGPATDTALFMVFTDVDRALPELENLVQTAEAAGAARRYGFGLTAQEADLMQLNNIEYDEALKGFANLDLTRGLFEETLYEQDFTIGREGIAAQFGLEGGAAEKVARRGESRRAETSGSAGGAIEEKGATGLGAAGRR